LACLYEDLLNRFIKKKSENVVTLDLFFLGVCHAKYVNMFYVGHCETTIFVMLGTTVAQVRIMLC
jgi:hypothetical protein